MSRKLKSFQERYKNIPVSPNGLLDFPNQKVIVPTEDGMISMKGIPYPVIGKDDTGHTKLMFPEQEYKFPGAYVYECPLSPEKIADDKDKMRYGGELKKYQSAGTVYDPDFTLDPASNPYTDLQPSGPPIPVVTPESYNVFDRPPIKLDPNQQQSPSFAGDQPTGGVNQQEFIKPKEGLISPTPGYDPWKINETGKPEKDPEKVKKPDMTIASGPKIANKIMTGMGLLTDFLNKRNYEEEYKRKRKELGNTNAMDTEFQGFSPYGDYTVNAGQGQNFRPNQMTYARSYQKGGEYKEGTGGVTNPPAPVVTPKREAIDITNIVRTGDAYIINTKQGGKPIHLPDSNSFNNFVLQYPDAWKNYVHANRLNQNKSTPDQQSYASNGNYEMGGEYNLSRREIKRLKDLGYEIDLL